MDFSVSLLDGLEANMGPGLLDASLADPQPWVLPDPIAGSVEAVGRDGFG